MSTIKTTDSGFVEVGNDFAGNNAPVAQEVLNITDQFQGDDVESTPTPATDVITSNTDILGS